MVPPLFMRGSRFAGSTPSVITVLRQVARRAQRHLVHLGQRRRVGDVVEVAVADQQHVDLAEGSRAACTPPA
jgi:hypothetical protein